MVMSVNLTIPIPEWLDRICAWPVVVYRKRNYGYTYRRIYLGDGEWTLLDEEDYYKYGKFRWTLGGYRKNFYAVSGIKNEDGEFKILRLHREIMEAPEGLVVDHRDGNGLDNRRENLRLATKAQNARNRRKSENATSRFIGVYYDKRRGHWIARIWISGKIIRLGQFESEIEAARAYDRAAIKYLGEFAHLNFPREDYVNENCISNSK
jgi:hypothetical protein